MLVLGGLLAAFCGPVRAVAETPPAGSGVLRYAFPVAETGFDPVQVSDLYSNFVNANMFDTPLAYDYLARPVKVVPSTLEAMPEISADGLTWTMRVKRGIRFSDDPAFNGKPRELVAADFVYTIKRLFDPRWKSPNLYTVEGFLVGMDAVRAKAIATGRMDYDSEVEGLRVIDRYTWQVKLVKRKYNLVYLLTDCQVACAVAREVIEAYPESTMEHPVGTGPYRLEQWRRSSKIVLVASPTYRDVRYEATPAADDPAAQAIAARFKGRKLPMTPRVEISIIEETQPRWLAFLNGEHDLLERLPEDFANVAVPNGKLAPNLVKRHFTRDRNVGVELTFTYFAMDNPVIGGYTPEKVALRRAITLGYDNDAEIRVVRKGQAIPAQSVIAPGAAGYDPAFRSVGGEYDPAKARALLDIYGYVDRDGDGYRETPDGQPLTYERSSQPTPVYKQIDELWKKSMDAIGIRFVVRKGQFPELLKQSKAGQLMSWGLAWSSSVPDAESFEDVFYGPNAGQSNHSRFDLPEFNRLFEESQQLPDGPERNALYLRMNKLMLAYAPWKLGVHRIYTDLMQPWVHGYRRHPVMRGWWQFVDVDSSEQQAALKR